MSERLLIQSCSAQKRPDPGLLPAIERYDGPAFRLLRKAGRAGHLIDVYTLIISAEHGLIPEDRNIADYDRNMDRDRAAEITVAVSTDLWRWFRNHPDCRSVCINVGPAYQAFIAGFPEWCERHGIAVIVCAGGIGQRLTQIKAWLEASR